MQSNKDRAKPGLAAVEKEKLKVFDPSPGGPSAKIKPAEEIILEVNGIEVTSEVEVTRNDTIEILPKSELTAAEISVDVSKDKMAAYLKILPEIKTTYVLKDHPPSPNLKLETEQQTEEIIQHSFNDVLHFLKQKGIVQPDIQAIQEALHSSGGKKVLVASGTPPTPPRDEKVEIKTAFAKASQPMVKADGRVDYRESASNAGSVEQGDLLAIKHPGAPGEPGRDVLGNIIKPRAPQTLEIQAGSGTELRENNTQVVATRSGRPEVKEGKTNYSFAVEPNLVHKGSVSLDSGNIRFKGDVHIQGEVQQGMVVYSGGKLQVDGLISSATVTSGSHITLNGHVLASKIGAGAAISSINRVLPLLDDLQQSVSQLQMALRQTLSQLKAQVAFGKMAALLIEKKFPSFHPGIKKLLNILDRDASLPKEVEPLATVLNQKFRGIKVLQLSGIEDIKELLDVLHQTQTYLRFIKDNQADIQLPYALNSTVEATGNVFITGQGCIETKIIAGGAVVVQGLFRGGSIEAGDSVTLTEVGSKTGVPTHIRVPAQKSVFFQKAYENVTLEIGEQQYLHNQIDYNKEARLDVFNVVEFVQWTPGKNPTRAGHKN